MTREEVLAMPAGPALDALVAEQLLPTTVWRLKEPVTVGVPGHERQLHWRVDNTLCAECPPYSTDIAEAWKVLDARRDTGFTFSLLNMGHQYEANFVHFGDPFVTGSADAREAPEAICRAALLTLF